MPKKIENKCNYILIRNNKKCQDLQIFHIMWLKVGFFGFVFLFSLVQVSEVILTKEEPTEH